MKNMLLKSVFFTLIMCVSAGLKAGLSDSIADYVASKAPTPAVTSSCGVYSTSALAAQGFNLVPGVKQTMKDVCCKSPNFRSKNPNTVAKALDNCAGVEAEENFRATDEDFCKVAALAGGSLKSAPKTVKTKLLEMCSEYPEIMDANPKAAEAIGYKSPESEK